MAFMAAMFFMYQPFRNLTRTYTVLHQGLAGAERVFEILDEPPSSADKPDADMAPRFAKAIEFHDVSFAYGAKPVLSRIHLTIRAGEVVALVGMSGAGKSTLADLIPRFLRCELGAKLPLMEWMFGTYVWQRCVLKSAS
jgi:subfamily B ATP-binding cassette protein MsbA